MSDKSEFGKGLCYCLGLFLAHAEGIRRYKEKFESIPQSTMNIGEMWFNGAADHLFDFMPEQAPEHMQQRCRDFQSKCIGWRLCMNGENEATEDDVMWALQEAKDLLREIDIHHNIPAVKGQWE